MNYKIEFMYRKGEKLDTNTLDVKTRHNPFEIATVNRLQNHIKKLKNYEQVFITHVAEI